MSKNSKVAVCLALVLALALPVAASAQMKGTSNSRNLTGGTMGTATSVGNQSMGGVNSGAGFSVNHSAGFRGTGNLGTPAVNRVNMGNATIRSGLVGAGSRGRMGAGSTSSVGRGRR